MNLVQWLAVVLAAVFILDVLGVRLGSWVSWGGKEDAPAPPLPEDDNPRPLSLSELEVAFYDADERLVIAQKQASSAREAYCAALTAEAKRIKHELAVASVSPSVKGRA